MINKDSTEEEMLKDLVSYYPNDYDYIGCSHIQRRYKIGYNKAQRVIDLGLKVKAFQRKEDEPWRVRFA